MAAYFRAANLWAFVALAAWVGKSPVTSSANIKYSFFDLGREMSPYEYGFFVAVPAVMAMACFALWFRSSQAQSRFSVRALFFATTLLVAALWLALYAT